MVEETMDLQIEETEKQEVVESGAERTRERACFVPRADIYETIGSITVVADMPGVDKNSVDITLEQDVLTINGYTALGGPQGYRLAYAEYQAGDYQRRFTLSDKIDRDKIEATMKDGVLRLRLPKVEPTATKIAVKAG
jgi:HSP20 family molecular chaperone IbpA